MWEKRKQWDYWWRIKKKYLNYKNSCYCYRKKILRKEEGSRKENRGEENMTKGGRKNKEEERGKRKEEQRKNEDNRRHRKEGEKGIER